MISARRSRAPPQPEAPAWASACDSRSPRDGRFIEEVGTYDPIANPAKVQIDADRVRDWMSKGARPSDIVLLAGAEVDAVIAISPENVFYLSRALILTQRYIPDRLAIVVWPRGGEPTLMWTSEAPRSTAWRSN